MYSLHAGKFATFQLQADQASNNEERVTARLKLTDACMELAVVDFVFYLNNPCHFSTERNWQVKEGKKATSKHKSMANAAVRHGE